MQKTSQFKTQCKGDISHAYETAKITVFYPTLCSRCALTKRAVVLNICTLKFIAYFYFVQIVCLIIVDYTTVGLIMLVAHLMWGKGNDLKFQVRGDIRLTMN